MNSKIFFQISLVIFQILFKNCCAECDSDNKALQGLSILKPTANIRLGKQLEHGDVIIATGRFLTSGTEASFDLENDKCNWSSGVLSQCLEYDITLRFHEQKMYRRIYVNGGFKHNIDTYTPKLMRRGKFELVIKVKSHHFEIYLDGCKLTPFEFKEPIESLTTFSVYGFAVLESFKIDAGLSIVV